MSCQRAVGQLGSQVPITPYAICRGHFFELSLQNDYLESQSSHRAKGILMSVFLAQDESAPPDNMELLRSECGWTDVAQGLARILMGYAILIGGALFGIGLIAGAVVMLTAPGHKPDDKVHIWIFYGGLALLSMTGLFAYGTLMAGKLRCLMGAPERNNAKWLMFACMACLVMGPVLNIVTGMTGVSKGPEFKEGAAGFKLIKYTSLGRTMQLACAAIGLASQVCFLFFLQAIARSFEDGRCASHVTFYLVVVLILITGTLALPFAAPKLLLKPAVLIALGIGWAISGVWYLFLIAKVRLCIVNGMKQIKSPLALDAGSAQ
jgi:hypothetical protein